MPNNIQEGSSLSGRHRVLNADGTVSIHCRQCGVFIMRMMYRGFTTSICTKCQGIEVPEVQAQRDEALLYTEEPEKEKMGLARSVFRALGFGRPKQPKAPSKKSRAVAKERQRKPLFGPEDEE
jgi:hypothetical protein